MQILLKSKIRCQPTASACVHSKRRTYTKDEHPYHYEELSLSNLDILIFGSTDISVFGKRKKKDKEKAEKWKIMYVLGGILEAPKKKIFKSKIDEINKGYYNILPFHLSLFYPFTIVYGCPFIHPKQMEYFCQNERICGVGCRGIERRMILTYAWIIV